jgi:hypothetical protein
MTTVKFTVAEAEMVPVPDVNVEAAEAMSGSANAPVPNKLVKAIEVFIVCIL